MKLSKLKKLGNFLQGGVTDIEKWTTEHILIAIFLNPVGRFSSKCNKSHRGGPL